MENPKLYSSANGMQRKDAEDVLEELRHRVAWGGSPRVLDVGCGSGEVTMDLLLPRLPEDFVELVGIDVSLEMIQHARNLHSHPKVSFIHFDIAQTSDNLTQELRKTVTENSDLKNKRSNQTAEILLNNKNILSRDDFGFSGYDVVTSFYCLHWVSNQRLAMKNIFNLLKPSGESLLAFLAKSPIFTLYRKLSTTDPWKDYMQDVDNFIPFYQDSDEPLIKFTEILNSSGFRILTVDYREKNYTFNSFTALKNAIIAVNPFLSRIPEELRKSYIEECLRQTEYLKLVEFKNNSYKVSYNLIVAHLRKP